MWCVVEGLGGKVSRNEGKRIITSIQLGLQYHHLLGVLIYFDEVPGLCDYVIMDHQWWFDKLSNIISNTF